MSVLELVRDNCGDDILAYADPVWAKLTFNSKKRGKKIPAKFWPLYFFLLP
jgi:hypothetical protein